MAHMGLNQYLQQVRIVEQLTINGISRSKAWFIHIISNQNTLFAPSLVCVQVEQCIRMGDGDVLAVSQLQAMCIPVMLTTLPLQELVSFRHPHVHSSKLQVLVNATVILDKAAAISVCVCRVLTLRGSARLIWRPLMMR